MSAKKNRDAMEQDNESSSSSPSDDEQDANEQDSDVDSDGNYIGDKEMQADFEGRNPEDCDYHGIKQLLRQLFLKANVDLGALTDIIISQNYIGSVVKQCLDDGDDDDDDEDDDDGPDGVFGITTVINITKRKDEPAIQQIRTLLTTLAEENADARTKSLVKDLLSNGAQVGLVLNERILNIPAQISVPLFASLLSEQERAIKKDMPYKFQYLIWISKTFNPADYEETMDEDNLELIYANQEERAIVPEAIAHFDVDVSSQVDYSQWDYEGGAMSPSRKIMIFEGSKFANLVNIIKQEVEATE